MTRCERVLTTRCIMTDLSDRQHDAFDNAAKTACREGKLRVYGDERSRLGYNRRR